MLLYMHNIYSDTQYHISDLYLDDSEVGFYDSRKVFMYVYMRLQKLN